MVEMVSACERVLQLYRKSVIMIMLFRCVFGHTLGEQQEPNFVRVGAPAFFIVSYNCNAPREFDEIFVSFSESVVSFILTIASIDDPVESDD